MHIAWKRTLLAAGVVASSALAAPAFAGHSHRHASHHFGHSREVQIRHHSRSVAGVRHAQRIRRLARSEHRRFVSAGRRGRIVTSASAGSSGNSSLVAEARRYLGDAPWMFLAPTGTIMLCVLSINFVGDGLRDALDPRAWRTRAGRAPEPSR